MDDPKAGGIFFGNPSHPERVTVESLEKDSAADRVSRLRGLSKILEISFDPGMTKVADLPDAPPVVAKPDALQPPEKEIAITNAKAPPNPVFIDDLKEYLAKTKTLNEQVAKVGWDPKTFGSIKTYFGAAVPAHPVVYSSVLTNRFGGHWARWELDTLISEVRHEKLFDIDSSPLVLDMVAAIQTLFSHQGYWDDWALFQNITLALNGHGASFRMVQPPSPAQILFSLETAERIRPIPTESIHPDVWRFIAGSFRWHGLNFCVGVAATAQPYMVESTGAQDPTLVRVVGEAYNKVRNDLGSGAIQKSRLFEEMAIGETYEEIQIFRSILIAIYLHEKAETEKEQLYARLEKK